MAAHLKQWLIVLRSCFDGSELLARLLSSLHIFYALRSVSPV